MTSHDMSTEGRQSLPDLFLVMVFLRLVRRIDSGRLRLTLPNGRTHDVVGAKPGPVADLTIRRWRSVARLRRGGVGFAEGYIAGDWDSSDLGALLLLLAGNLTSLMVMRSTPPWRRLAHLILDWRRRNTPVGARRNIAAHYDLGNSFYALWLDRTLAYSCAVFQHPSESLADAQVNKYRELAALADLRPEQEVLEIGCGWGGFALWAAREIGCRITALTISEAQFNYAASRVKEEGLADRIAVRQLDYRHVTGRFDRIVSIEMFEAVGEAYWGKFFSTLRDRLVPCGRAAMQVITIDDAAFKRYRTGVDFVQSYIFPGGMLPTVGALQRYAGEAGLAWRHRVRRGGDYAATLASWRDRFDQAWPEVRALGFDEGFRRMWRYYLSYCDAGFRVGRLDLQQIALQRI